MIGNHGAFVARVLYVARTPPGDIDDQVQLTFITAARRLDDVRIGCEKAFLFRIAMNHAAHARRTLTRRREVQHSSALERVPTSTSLEHLMHLKTMCERLDEILDQMDGDVREAFVLKELEALSTPQIARRLGIPTGTVASRLRRARADLHRRASPLGDDPEHA